MADQVQIGVMDGSQFEFVVAGADGLGESGRGGAGFGTAVFGGLIGADEQGPGE